MMASFVLDSPRRCRPCSSFPSRRRRAQYLLCAGASRHRPVGGVVGAGDPVRPRSLGRTRTACHRRAAAAWRLDVHRGLGVDRRTLSVRVDFIGWFVRCSGVGDSRVDVGARSTRPCSMVAASRLLRSAHRARVASLSRSEHLAGSGHDRPGRVESDAAGKRLVLLAPDETTRAMIDMYARTSVDRIAGPLDASAADRAGSIAAAAPDSLFLAQFPTPRARVLGQLLRRKNSPAVDTLTSWMQTARMRIVKTYALPNGRRYALLEITP